MCGGVCDDPLQCLRVHDEGQLVAVGNSNGTTYLVEFSESLVSSNRNDRPLLTAVSDTTVMMAVQRLFQPPSRTPLPAIIPFSCQARQSLLSPPPSLLPPALICTISSPHPVLLPSFSHTTSCIHPEQEMLERESRREKILEARTREIRLRQRTRADKAAVPQTEDKPRREESIVTEIEKSAANEFLALIEKEMKTDEEDKHSERDDMTVEIEVELPEDGDDDKDDAEEYIVEEPE
uniref:Uncharacterized protein n=1 Tax=Timema tahoe TaxID=61484 RepID=A0A7R9IBR0_9NEOP|nr:unnamed protein product [Timema tahoe]